MRTIKMSTIKKFKLDLFSTLLIIIFIFGFLIRLVGTNPGYPPNHPDEPIINGTAIQMVLEKELNPFTFGSYRFQYPGLVVYLHAFLYSVFFIPLTQLINIILQPFAFFSSPDYLNRVITTYIVSNGGVNALFWGRYITAFFGFLSVVLIYFVGKELFNKYVGLMAALFLAFNFRHVVSSHLSLIDTPNSTFALLALYLSVLLFKNPTKKRYLLSGLGVGLSFGTKLYFFSVLPFLFAHLLISLKKKNINKILQSLVSVNFFFGLLLAVGIFILFNPFLFLNPENLNKAFQQQSLNNLRYGMGSNVLLIAPLRYLYEIGFGREFSILFILGLVVTFLNPKYWTKAVFLLFFILPPSFILLYYSHGGAYVRNFTSIVPFAIIFSSLAFCSVIKFFLKKMRIKESKVLLVLLTLGLIVAFPQIKKSTALDFWLSKEWNFKCVQNWVEKNVKEGETIARTGSVPLPPNEKINYIPFTNNWLHNIGAFTLPELQDAKIEYVIVSYDIVQSSFNWWVGGKLWNMPVDAFENSYEGLAINELTRYSVKDCVKPWPSIDDNYSIFKIPEKKTGGDYQLIFSDNPKLLTEKVLNQSNSPKYYPISDFIPVEAGQEYHVVAEISAKKRLELKQRDGFLRVDFYEDKKETTKRGKIAAVSDRFWGDSWMEIKVTEVAPENVKWLRISFQAEDYTLDFQIRDLKIFISTDKPSQEEIRAANQKEIENSIIYPTSIL